MTVEITKNSSAEIADATKKKSCNRPWWPAMARGFMRKCPSCGKGNLYHAFLKISDKCPSCGEELHHHRADDAPPYFTIFIVGHILLPAIIVVEKVWRPEIWIHLSIWFPLTILMTVWLLPRVKGAVLGLQWALCMHGFEYSALCTPARQIARSTTLSNNDPNND